MQPFQFIGAGSYVNPATPIAVNAVLNDQPDLFILKDLTNWGNSVSATVQSEWWSLMPQGAYLATTQSAGNALSSARGTSGGFTFINQANPPTFASLAATAINNTTFVVSMANTGSIQVGDLVRVINPVGMNEIAGLIFAVTAVTPNTSITLGYAATAAAAAPGTLFAGPATSASITKIYPNRFYPHLRFVAYITQATQATVYFFEPNDFTVGEYVDFNIPTPYGMTQLSFLTKGTGQVPALVTAVTNSATQSSITINVDTTGFTPFIYPPDLVRPGQSPATCFPAGSGPIPNQSPPGVNIVDAFDNRNQYVMNIGLSVVGAANATMRWEAFRADYFNLSNQ